LNRLSTQPKKSAKLKSSSQSCASSTAANGEEEVAGPLRVVALKSKASCTLPHGTAPSRFYASFAVGGR